MEDKKILVGRKCVDEEPGFKFAPYLMLESTIIGIDIKLTEEEKIILEKFHNEQKYKVAPTT